MNILLNKKNFRKLYLKLFESQEERLARLAESVTPSRQLGQLPTGKAFLRLEVESHFHA